MQYNATFHGPVNDIFQMKVNDIFLIYDSNKDFGCLLEPPQWGGSNKHP